MASFENPCTRWGHTYECSQNDNWIIKINWAGFTRSGCLPLAEFDCGLDWKGRAAKRRRDPSCSTHCSW